MPNSERILLRESNYLSCVIARIFVDTEIFNHFKYFKVFRFVEVF